MSEPVTTTVHQCDYCHRDFTPKRSDARFCSDRCRITSHRRTKEQRRWQAEREAREAELARIAHEHRERFVVLVTKQNARITHTKASDLYDVLVKAGMVQTPFIQRRLF